MQLLLALAIGLLAADPEKVPEGPSKIMNIMTIVAIAFFFYLIVLKPSRDEKTRRSLLDAIKKNDRVVTAAGIKGIVSSVNREKNEAVVTIDENTKTRMTVTLDSIGHVVVDEKKTESDSES